MQIQTPEWSRVLRDCGAHSRLQPILQLQTTADATEEEQNYTERGAKPDGWNGFKEEQMLDLNIKALLKTKEQYMWTLSKRNAELQCLYGKKLTVGKRAP